MVLGGREIIAESRRPPAGPRPKCRRTQGEGVVFLKYFSDLNNMFSHEDEEYIPARPIVASAPSRFGYRFHKFPCLLFVSINEYQPYPRPIAKRRCTIVSCERQPLNTYLWRFKKALEQEEIVELVSGNRTQKQKQAAATLAKT